MGRLPPPNRRARQLDENLAALRRRILTSDTPTGEKWRNIFLRLERAHMAESHLISVLSVKLRLTHQSKIEKRKAEAEYRAMGVGARPWDAN
jgi:hypothetical protein